MDDLAWGRPAAVIRHREGAKVTEKQAPIRTAVPDIIAHTTRKNPANRVGDIFEKIGADKDALQCAASFIAAAMIFGLFA